MTIVQLYELAELNGIPIYSANLPNVESCSLQFDDGLCVIGIDRNCISSDADEKVKLAHELGHCIRGAFYNRYSRFDLISRHEYRADKWACEECLPKEEMQAAFEEGYVEVWQLAEYFGVTEELVKKALWIHFDKEVA